MEWKAGKWQSVGCLFVPEPEREREVRLNSHNAIAVSPYAVEWHSRLIGIPMTQLSMVGEKKELLVPGKKVSQKGGKTGYRKTSLLMNWPCLGLFEISGTKKTKL